MTRSSLQLTFHVSKGVNCVYWKKGHGRDQCRIKKHALRANNLPNATGRAVPLVQPSDGNRPLYTNEQWRTRIDQRDR